MWLQGSGLKRGSGLAPHDTASHKNTDDSVTPRFCGQTRPAVVVVRGLYSQPSHFCRRFGCPLDLLRHSGADPHPALTKWRFS